MEVDDAAEIDRKGQEECDVLRKWARLPGAKLRTLKKRESRIIDELAARMRRGRNSHRIWEYRLRAKALGMSDDDIDRTDKLRDIAIYRLYRKEEMIS